MNEHFPVCCGIDFGAQRAGTTVVALRVSGVLSLYRSIKGKETDPWLIDLITDSKPSIVAIDAPLSLPGIYLDRSTFADYFYRTCDRELQAMSPMFLGGLTARAIRIRDILAEGGSEVIETYPKQIRLSQMQVDLSIAKDKHEEDAIFCLSVAELYQQRRAKSVGLPEEGVIWLPD